MNLYLTLQIFTVDGVDISRRTGTGPGPTRKNGYRETVSDNLGRLDDEDFPVASMGQAAQLLGVRPAFLRSLDSAGVLAPYRTDGGHRRYSRRQLALADRLRGLLDAGHNLTSARAIAGLEDRLDRVDRAHRDADVALHAARHDLAERDDELERTRARLQDARAEISHLHLRLADPETGPQLS